MNAPHSPALRPLPMWESQASAGVVVGIQLITSSASASSAIGRGRRGAADVRHRYCATCEVNAYPQRIAAAGTLGRDVPSAIAPSIPVASLTTLGVEIM